MDDYKSKQAEIFCQFQKLGLINILKKNKNINSDTFRTYLNMLSIMINSIINNYYYTIEIYKIEIKKYQKHKENLIFEKENYKKIFINENIKEFIEYKNLEKEFINNVNNNNNINNKNFIEQNIDTIIKQKRFLEIQNLKQKYDDLFKKKYNLQIIKLRNDYDSILLKNNELQEKIIYLSDAKIYEQEKKEKINSMEKKYLNVCNERDLIINKYKQKYNLKIKLNKKIDENEKKEKI